MEKGVYSAGPVDANVRGKGRIKPGAMMSQDFNYGAWPNCCPPVREYPTGEYRYEAKDPDMVFDVEWNGSHWECRADGYGNLNPTGDALGYGNGSVLVKQFDGVELITPNAKLTGG